MEDASNSAVSPVAPSSPINAEGQSMSPVRPIRISNLAATAHRGKYPLSHLSWYYDDGTHDEWLQGSGAGTPLYDLRDEAFNAKHDSINVQLKERMAEVQKRAHRKKKDKVGTPKPPPTPPAPCAEAVSMSSGKSAVGGKKRPLTPLSMPLQAPGSPSKKGRLSTPAA
jgi:hypothetical protein